MATVTLVQVQPRRADNAALVDVRLAGGGTRSYRQLGKADWLAGVSRPPRFASSIGFDQSGFTGGALPQTGAIRFAPSTPGYKTDLAALVWKGARIVVRVGDDQNPFEQYPIEFVGTVASHSFDRGALDLTVADLSVDLAKPILSGTFAGTGGLEGDEEATGRAKRRSFGSVFNVEGFVLDKANNVYEFGDPLRPLTSFPMVKDKGDAYSPVNVIAWQGSAAATLDALRAATVPGGGVAVAPSIACVKPWTRPAGPITADLVAEAVAGNGSRPAWIAAKIIREFSADIVLPNENDAAAWQGNEAGIHVAETSEMAADVLDRLLLPVSIAWVLLGSGALYFRRLRWDEPVFEISAQTVERDVVYQPLRTRRVGFQLNNRIHSDSEISATILASTDPTYADGTPIDVLRPAEAGANVTENRTSAAFSGQGALATLNSLANGGPFLSGFGALSRFMGIRFGGESGNYAGFYDEQGNIALDAAFKTILGQAASFLGQGALATLSSLANGGPYLSGFGAISRFTGIRFGGESGDYAGFYDEQGGIATDALFKTALGTAAAIFGQGWGATAARADADNSYVARGANQTPNSDQVKLSWVTTYNPNGADLQPVGLARDTWGPDSYALSGKTANAWIRQAGVAPGTVDGSGDDAVAIDLYMTNFDDSEIRYTSPGAGKKVAASIYLASHRCSMAIYIAFCRVDGSTIHAPFGPRETSTEGNAHVLSAYKRTKLIATVPNDCAYFVFRVRKYNTYSTAADSYMWFAAPMVEYAADNQTEPSPYVSGPPSNPNQIGYVGTLDADKTSNNTAAAFAGQGALATLSSVAYGGAYLTGLPSAISPSAFFDNGRLLYASRVVYDDAGVVSAYRPQEAGANITENRSAASFLGQGAFATISQVDLTNTDRFTHSLRFAAASYGAQWFQAGNVAWGNGTGGTVEEYKPQERGANVTENRTSSAIQGQGAFATTGTLTRDSVFSAGFFALNTFSLGYSITRDDGTTKVTESLVVTSVGVAAGFVNQGALATRNNVSGDEVINGRLKNSNGSVYWDLAAADGRRQIANAGYRYVDGAAIGANDDVIQWYGPTSVPEGGETKTNGVFAMGADGKVYYGNAELGAGGGAANGSVKKSADVGFGLAGSQTSFVTVASMGVSNVPPNAFVDFDFEINGQPSDPSKPWNGEYQFVAVDASGSTTFLGPAAIAYSTSSGALSPDSGGFSAPLARSGAVTIQLQLRKTIGGAQQGLNGSVRMTYAATPQG